MLELKRISAGYDRKAVLKDVSVSFEKGKLTAVVGVNGCGKSTLLKTALGILPPTDGEVLLDGACLHTLDRREIAQKVAYLAQGKSTPDMTVRQMVLHGRFPYLSYPRRYTSLDVAMAKEAMMAVGISHLADCPLDALSGGMRQNAYIAMALAQDTDYILLDEPTTYLDVSHQLDTMRILRRLADAGRGIVTVMHDLPLALDFSDDVVVMNGSGIAAVAPPQDVSDSGVIQEIFGVQMGRTEKGKFYYQY